MSQKIDFGSFNATIRQFRGLKAELSQLKEEKSSTVEKMKGASGQAFKDLAQLNRKLHGDIEAKERLQGRIERELGAKVPKLSNLIERTLPGLDTRLETLEQKRGELGRTLRQLYSGSNVDQAIGGAGNARASVEEDILHIPGDDEADSPAVEFLECSLELIEERDEVNKQIQDVQGKIGQMQASAPEVLSERYQMIAKEEREIQSLVEEKNTIIRKKQKTKGKEQSKLLSEEIVLAKRIERLKKPLLKDCEHLRKQLACVIRSLKRSRRDVSRVDQLWERLASSQRKIQRM